MLTRRLIALTAVLTLAAPLAGWAYYQQEKDKPSESPEQPSAAQMAEMMAKAAKFTQPSDHHKVLERFIGKWTHESRMFMGGQATPPEKGSAESKWMMDGRWMQSQTKGTMMGMPMQGFLVMGYDNFKMSYVGTFISSIDTAMLRFEGDLDPSGNVLILYGTLDEYLTGEHDKMVKYVWRFEGDDKIIFEIHDLPIGEKNTKVMEIVSTRVK